MTDPAEFEIQVFRDGMPAVRDFPRRDRERASALLLDAIRADESQIRAGSPTGAPLRAAPWRDKRVRSRVLVGMLTAVAAAGAGAAVVVSLLPGTPAPRSLRHAQTAAMAVLERAAVTAGRQAATGAPRPGQYLYIKDIEFKLAAGPGASRWARKCSTVVGQEWMAADGSGRQVGSYTSRACHGFVQAWPKGGANGTNPLDWPLNLLGWEGLPARPAAIDMAIVRRYEGGHALNTATFAYAAALLQENAPPRIRAALFRAIGLLPGVRDLGSMTDRLGRHGIGIGLAADGARQELIFDPITSRALEAEIVAVAPRGQANNGGRPGTVLGYTVYVTAGVVKSDTATLPTADGPLGSSG